GHPDSGFSLCDAARIPAHAATEGDDRAVLAHPLAQCRDLRRLPVEARDAVAHADGRYPGLSHALSLSEFPVDARPLHRVPDRPRAHDGGTAGPHLPCRRLSDFDRMAPTMAAGAARAPALAPRRPRTFRHRR